MKNLVLLSLCAAVLGACTTTTLSTADYAGLGSPSDPIPFNEKIFTGQLANGLHYYILENPRPEQRAYLTLAVNAGSLLEQEDERGLAHFVEHMAFNGTARFPEQDLINYLRSLGMRFGADVNAYTHYDKTVYGIEVPVKKDESGIRSIPLEALQIIDDWTYAITFDPKDVDEERPVIIEELRARGGLSDRIQQRMTAALFHDSRYATRSPKGLGEIIETAPASVLERFYKTWYRPDNMAVIFVGDFDGAALKANLDSYFSAPAPTGPLNRPVYDLPPPKQGRLSIELITDPEQTTTLLSLYYKRAHLARTNDLASYRLAVIDNLIERILSLHFSEKSADPDNAYLAGMSNYMRYGASSRYYSLAVLAKTGAAHEALRELFLEKETIIRYGFTAEELEWAKRALISDMEQAVSEKETRESEYYLEELTDCFLYGASMPSIDWELDAVKRLLPGITEDDVTAVGRSYFASDDLTVLVIAPESEPLPDEQQIQKLASQIRRTKITRPQPLVVSGELLDTVPAAGSITSEMVDAETGTLLWTLSNGARVIIKQTANRNNEISFYALAKGGTASVPLAQNISARFSAELSAASGVGSFSLTELTKKLADKQLSLGGWVSAFTRTFQGFTSTGDMRTFFEMLYLNFTQPRIDSTAFTTLMQEYRTLLTGRSDNPDAYFSDEITKIIYGYHPFFMPLTLADLDKVNQEDAYAFLQKALNPADWTFVFAGSIDTALIRPLVETYLAAIPAKSESWHEWSAVSIKRPGAGTTTLNKGLPGAEAKSQVYMASFVAEPFSESKALTAVVLNEYLDIHLTQTIREALGATYSIYVNTALSPFPPEGELSLSLLFTCSPDRATATVEAVRAEIASMAAGEIDPDILNKAIAAVTKDWEQSMQSNTYISQLYANFSVLFNLPLGNLDRRPQYFAAVSAADLQEMSRLLLEDGPAVIILYPDKD
ncbi:MAG: insulinase family protein [Spirochaetaceae bacterium]|jgi:zinc protease|nr:insulinase family protein [Spirochaetaceae bacterium]